MTKQCVNNECNAFMEDGDMFCKLCGAKQPSILPEKKKPGWFGKKKQTEMADAKILQSEDMEDFRLSPEFRMGQSQAIRKKDDTGERLSQIEEKLDVMLKNHNWLLINVDAWLQGYRQKSQKEEVESTESDK